PEGLFTLAQQTEASAARVAQELRRRPPNLQAVECEDGALVVVFLQPGFLIVYLDDAALYARVVNLATEDRARVSGWAHPG
ncbi:MAG TPA: hypothetical protein VHN99_02685, partial [Deinococcales bacterium]|nr:hypothetical protein [Deinococcales bacterium]